MAKKQISEPQDEKSKGGSTAVAAKRDKGLKIYAYQVENIKRIDFVRIRPNGDLIVVSGRNGSGKTTLLDGIEWALTGEKNIPSNPIKKGETHGNTQIDIGEFLVTRTYDIVPADKSKTGKEYTRTKLVVKDRAGNIQAGPQDLLDRLMKRIARDPLEFIRMEPEKQFDALRKLAGLDVSEFDAEIKVIYNQRRAANQEEASAEARLKAIPTPAEGLPPEPIDTAALTRELAEAGNRNTAAAELARKRDQEFARVEQLEKEADAHAAEIAELERRIARLREAAKEARDLAKNHRASAEAIQVPAPIDTAALAAALQKAQTTNQQIQQRSFFQSVERQFKEAQAESARLTKELEAKRAAREKAIASVKVPVKGLTFGDNEVLYKGIPFAQASNGEQIRVSTALVMAANPDLRVLWIKDGSLLDEEGMEEIAQMAKREGYQVWVERVEGGPAQIVMEEGKASGEAVDPVPAAQAKGRRL